MGNYDGRKYTNLKMAHTTWLSLMVALVTLVSPALSSSPRVVCYYTNWSVYRPGTAKFNPQNINPYLCTHLVYAFGGFTKDNTLKPFDKYQDIEKGGYAKFTGLKTYNKNLKTLLAIGGWNEGSSRFSPMVAAKDRRREFVRNVIKFLRQNHFDGLDLDWEYPAFRDGGKPKDRENYAKLVKELREEFDRESEKTGKPRLLLTMAVPAGIEYIEKGFDVKTLNRYLDWMNLLTYDYHSAFEPAVNHHAPLYPLEEPNEYSVDNELNIDYTIKFYLENGADRDKLVLGIPTYGRSYTLFNPDAYEIGSPADGPGEQGEATREKGYLAYYEICESLKPKTKKRAIASDEYSEEEEEEESEEEVEEEWTVMYPNKKAMGPVAYKGNQWVGYDDIDIVKKKAEYVAENGLGGIMFWSIDNDDFRGTCHGKPYPLIEAAKEAYIAKLGSTDITAFKDTPKVPTKSGNRRRNRPRSSTTTTTTTTTQKPKIKSNKRKSGSTTTVSTTPSWNIITPEPPTTPDPGSDFKCKDEGFFPHPRDCKKYFWCLDSGPSDLGIVAHQFTCPSGLYFNKAADSCDFARNVLCKKPAATTKAPTKSTTAKTTVSTTSTTTTTTTTRRPIRLTSRSSLLIRTSTTTTTTTPAPKPEVSEEESEEETVDEASDVEAEDPKVIKELIDLIKKVGGVEQLEKHLKLSESGTSAGTTDGVASTTPSTFNKKLYQKVLERARGKNKFGSNSITDSTAQQDTGVQNSRRGPQNAGLESAPDNDRPLRKDRPQYTTINRSRPSTSTTEEPIESEEVEEESEEVQQLTRLRGGPVATVGTTPKPLQYVNIRRTRPSTAATEAPDESRNALFERVVPYVTVEESPNSLDILSARRENVPEYVTIRRSRPTTAETTTIQYQVSEQPEESQEAVLEREITSQSSQPLYTSVLRTRSTTLPPVEEPNTPEPTTVLSVQISSLLNPPNTDETERLQPGETQTTVTQTTELPEPETSTTSTTTVTTPASTTTTTTTSAPASAPTRRTVLRRRGSTSPTTTTAAPVSTTQAAKERRPFLRRTKATAPPDTTDAPSADTPSADTTVETTTSKFTRRGNNRFKIQKTEREKPRGADAEKPSLNGGAPRSDRPRNFIRRRLGGANVTSTTVKPTSPLVPLRRGPFRVASRRRPLFSTTTTTASKPTTTMVESDESLQDIVDIDTDAIEDPSLRPSTTQQPTTSVQRRRPLVQLKNEDQNLAATNEEEKKRQSKKYSSSFKQNQLDEILRLRSSAEEIDVTTEGKTTIEDISAETAVALAAHQLLGAPVPVIPDYDDEPKSTRRPSQTIVDYKFTSPEYTEDYTKTQSYPEEYTRTPSYTTRNPETPTGAYTQAQTDLPSTRPSLETDTRLPAFTTPGLYTNRFSRPTIDSTNTINPTVSGVTQNNRFSRPTVDSTNTINPTVSGITQNNRFSRPTVDSTNTINPTVSGVSVNNRFSRPTVDSTNTINPTVSGVTLNRFSRPTVDATNIINPTASGITLTLGSEGSGESTARYTNFPTETNPPSYTTSNYESRVSRPGFTTVQNPTTPTSLNFRESTQKYTNTGRDVSPTYPTGFTSKVSRPAGFSPNLVNLDEVKSTVRFTSEGPSTASYDGASEKIPAPLVFGYSTGGQGLQEPSYFTREYLLESPVTKSYDDEYQYLSPKVTSPQPSSRRPVRRKFVNRRISTTQSPTSALPQTTLKPRRTTRKPFEKIPVKKVIVQQDNVQKESVQTPVESVQKTVVVERRPVQKVQKTFQKIAEPSSVFRPVSDYDYDEDQKRVVEDFEEDNKVILHGKGNIECLDIGNFAHPSSCKKFISCARMESGAVIGWEYICPKGLSFDPVGGICNWSAGLGCNEKDA